MRRPLSACSLARTRTLCAVCSEQPNKKIDSATGGPIWKWAYSSTTKETGGVFLIASSSNTASETGATYVEFQSGKVTTSRQDCAVGHPHLLEVP